MYVYGIYTFLSYAYAVAAKAWPDAVRLAFSFLDVDRDGMLSAGDLLAHVAGSPQSEGRDESDIILTLYNIYIYIYIQYYIYNIIYMCVSMTHDLEDLILE